MNAAERQAVLDLLHSERFLDQAPAQVCAALLDKGRYLCSVRTMYRILDANQEVRERRHQRRHPVYRKPELLATGPNQVWTWDITRLKGPRKWTSFSLYVHPRHVSAAKWWGGWWPIANRRLWLKS